MIYLGHFIILVSALKTTFWLQKPVMKYSLLLYLKLAQKSKHWCST